jgi:hypothetical protein
MVVVDPSPGTPRKILHGRIVVLIQPLFPADSGDAMHPMSRPLTRLALRRVLLCVLQCETVTSGQEIRDLMNEGLYPSIPKRGPYGRPQEQEDF